MRNGARHALPADRKKWKTWERDCERSTLKPSMVGCCGGDHLWAVDADVQGRQGWGCYSLVYLFIPATYNKAEVTFLNTDTEKLLQRCESYVSSGPGEVRGRRGVGLFVIGQPLHLCNK